MLLGQWSAAHSTPAVQSWARPLGSVGLDFLCTCCTLHACICVCATFKDICVVYIYVCMNICVCIYSALNVYICVYTYIYTHTYIYLDYYWYMNIFKTNGAKVLLNHVRKKLMKLYILVILKNWCSLSPFENEL